MKLRRFYDEASGVFENADYKSGRQTEIYFQNVIFVIFKITGFYTEEERSTARNRIDVVIKTSDYIYIIERNGKRGGRRKIFATNIKKVARIFAPPTNANVSLQASETQAISEWLIESLI